MKRWLRPSLMRRTVLTLAAALLLVWLALSLKDYLNFKRDVETRESTGRITLAIVQALHGLDNDGARAAMLATDRHFNTLRRQADAQAPGVLLFQLTRVDGATVYRSSLDTPWPAADGIGHGGDAATPRAVYWPVARANGPWRLAVWVPAQSDAHALAIISLDILNYILIALPLVMLPIALAVWQGLKPLRHLARRVNARPHDDLAPLQEPTGYAELAPLVQAFNHLLTRARHHGEVERRFVQDAAHELKTPLAALAAQAHVFVNSQDGPERIAAQQALEQGIARVSHQVNQLVTLSMLDRSEPCQWTRLDLGALAQETLAAMAPMARQREIEISLDAPHEMPVQAEADAVRTILCNLLGNALRHTGAGYRVEVRLSAGDGQVRMVVADDGPGIAPADMAGLFERFRRGGSSRGSGSGLGLAIVRKAVSRMGGDIHLTGGLDGRGVAFVVSWPGADPGRPAPRPGVFPAST